MFQVQVQNGTCGELRYTASVLHAIVVDVAVEKYILVLYVERISFSDII